MKEHSLLDGLSVDLTKFFATIEECVAITDAKTDELLYLNLTAMNTFGIKSINEIKGKKCYEIFNELPAPCPFCKHTQPKVNEFRDWAYFNSKLKRYCLLHDTLFENEGRLLHFEMLSSINNQHWLSRIIEQMTFNDRVVNEAVGLALSESDPDHALDLFLQHIGEGLNASRCVIFENNENNGKGKQDAQGTFANTYEWRSPDSSTQSNSNAPHEVPWENVVELWYHEFDKHNNVVVTDLEAYREVAPDIYDILKPRGIKTLIAAPIVMGSKRIGFYSVDNPRIEAFRNTENLYEILGDFIAAMLRHRDNMRKLEFCSTMDQLTGVSNRHALSMYFNDAEKSQSLGIIFCDINGLKKTNDEYGHAAGDDLIRRAVKALRTLFEPHRIFRMGGDEFLCIRRGGTQESLNNEMQQIRDACAQNNVSMALGAIWQPDDSTNFDALLKQVDAEMYADKRRHYRERRAR